MRLTFENILFIDNYLENSDVIYKDIRLEMIDHIASAIEAKMANGDDRDFYYIFKDYMVEHKARLLNNNKQFIKSADKKLLKLIVKQLVSLPCVVAFIAFLFIFNYVNYSLHGNITESWVSAVPILTSIVLGLIYIIALQVFKLNRFSSLERLGFIFGISFQLFHFCWNITNLEFMQNLDVVFIGLVSFTLSALLAMVLVTFKQVKYYKKQFKETT